MFAEEPNNACFKVPVKRYPIKTRWIDANARVVRFQLRRARRQEGIMTGCNDANVGVARQAAGDARRARRVDASASELRSPNLKWNLDGCQIVRRESRI
jgi:hypothetical protein